jgi:diguanylate cyclase (GGDEF)-like protein
MENRVVRVERVIARYRRLWDDYFPTSQHSSTPVKLTACLTEATTLWNATGGVIMTRFQGNELEIAAVRGADLARDTKVEIQPGTIIMRCYSRGKLELADDLTGQELLPSVSVASAVCLPIVSGAAVRGVLVLWSDEKDQFKEPDLSALPLFAHYTSVLFEVDELSERLGENLSVDPLTGLLNRRQFDRKLRDEVMRASRYSINLSLVVFDVDSLEEYNNACGHMLGNLALSDIASVFKKGAREVDYVARIGADEFAVILPETTRLGALRLADRLRGEVATYPFPVSDDQTSASLTVCAGVANFPSSASDEHMLLSNAYEALELAKSMGPDNIKLWGEKTSGARPGTTPPAAESPRQNDTEEEADSGGEEQK